MPKLLVIHGAGMQMRGKSQIEVFGKMTLPEYDEYIHTYAKDLGFDVEIFMSNRLSVFDSRPTHMMVPL